MFHRLLLISALASGCAASAMAQTVVTTPAPTPVNVTRTYVFPPVTLASTETARVIVVNTAAPATGNSTAPSCTGSISFLSSGTSQTLDQTPFTLGAGQFATVSLPYNASGITTSPGEVVGQVTQNQALGQAAAPCSLNLSLVVIDTSSGVGHLVLGNASAQAVSVPVPLPFGGR